MRRVAVLGSQFPPSGLPAALRLTFIAPHLEEFGWKPTVVTVQSHHHLHSVDDELVVRLPEGLEIVRTGAVPARIARRFGVGDVGIRSLGHAWSSLVRLCSDREFGAIWISVPPAVPMVLGRLARARFGVPYIIDYQDPWVTDYYWRLPRQQRPPKWRLASILAQTVEPWALRYASHVTAVSRGTVESVLSRYPWLVDLPTTEIPLGAEPRDFELLRRFPRVNRVFDRDDGLFHASYVGAFIPSMHSATRALFAAVRRGLDTSPSVFRRLRLHFVGTSYGPNSPDAYRVLPLAMEAGVAHLVDEHLVRVPYLDALQVQLDSSLLLALGTEESHYTASKVFPYILAERPVLSIFHRASSAVEILERCGRGKAITFDNEHPPNEQVDEILASLTRTLAGPEGNAVPAGTLDAFDPYTARSMARRLAEVFDQVAEKGG